MFYLQYNFFQYIRIILSVNQKIQIGRFVLQLPPYHLFSLYKKIYKKYDKYLVDLSKNFKKSTSIVDIGANVGDTLFEFINKNTRPNFYCIEGDNFFFKYLKSNVIKIKPFIKTNIFLINEIVGHNLKGKLVGEGGTKVFVKSKKGIQTKSLNQIVKENKINKIKLIKIDVDGYDFNIINSGLKILKKFKPIIYFEIMIIHTNSLLNYRKTIIKLDKMGYKFWTLLDNYGNIIFKNKNTNQFLSFIKFSHIGDIYDVACYIKKIK